MMRWIPEPAIARQLSRQRVRTSSVLQYEAVECGAASLKIVLAYFGRIMPLAELRELCGISRDGVTAIQLKRAALNLGLVVKAFRCNADHLRAKGRFPCIVFWQFNHFLVVEGFSAGKAWLSDPAVGRRSVDDDEFLRSFTGVVLELEPGSEFQAGGQEPGLYRWTPQLLLPYRGLLLWLLLLAFTGSLPELFIAGGTSQFIDAFLQEGRQNIALPVIWITAIALLLLVCMQGLHKLILREVSDQLLKRVSMLLYVSLFSLPYRYFVQRMRGELATRLSLPFSLVQLSVNGAIDFLSTLFSSLMAISVALFISPLLSLFTLAVAGGNAAITIWVRNIRRGDNVRLAVLQGKTSGVGMYVIQCVESIKASGLENESFTQWAASFTDALEEMQKQSLVNSLLGVLGSTSGFVLRSGVILVGGLLIIGGRLSLGELMAFQFLLGMIEAPLQQLTQLSSQLQQLDGEMGRVNDVIDTEVDPRVRSFSLSGTAAGSRRLEGDLRIESLGFRFSSTTPLLFDGLALQLSPGSHLAIVGSSGSGKSTLLRLLAGLYTPTQGQVLYDSRPWLDWDDATLRNSIAMVSQEVFLFPASLEENITLWDPRHGSGDVIEALQQAELLEELGGSSCLSRHLGEGGGSLSGGQRQRVEIARALLRQPSLLLLDEATSALDELRERRIMAAVKEGGRTLVTVAHRLHAALISDWVLVLDQGLPVQQGSPSELASKEGPFQRLLAAETALQPQELTP